MKCKRLFMIWGKEGVIQIHDSLNLVRLSSSLVVSRPQVVFVECLTVLKYIEVLLIAGKIQIKILALARGVVLVCYLVSGVVILQ